MAEQRSAVMLYCLIVKFALLLFLNMANQCYIHNPSSFVIHSLTHSLLRLTS